jgi:hypothetical protein
MGDLGVYAGFIKDTVYATMTAFLLNVVHFPTYPVFFAHAATWLALFFFYISNADSFWAPTGAIGITLYLVALDLYVMFNTVCYLPGVACCLPGDVAAPFALSMVTCGTTNRVDSPLLTWLVLGSVGMGVFTGVVRVIGIYGTREGVSLEFGLAALYIFVKSYVLSWEGITFSIQFWVLGALTVALQASAIWVSFLKGLRYVAVLLLLAVVAVDVVFVTGLTPAVSAFKAGTSRPWNAQLNHGGRRLSAWSAGEGDKPPPAVKGVWLFLHAGMLTITVFEILGVLTRSPDLPGPYDRLLPGRHKKNDDEGGGRGDAMPVGELPGTYAVEEQGDDYGNFPVLLGVKDSPSAGYSGYRSSEFGAMNGRRKANKV